jgi:uncharacterized protein YndB with AHSA1/START domain
MLRKILTGLGVLVLVLAVVVSMQPATFAVERSVTIAAPTPQLYAQIANLRAMEAWSPFMKMDPANQKNTYTGPPSGVGAVCSWEGGDAGAGRLTIVGEKPNEQLDMRLEMIEPMQADNRVTFTLAPAGGATTVTWRIEGENSFVSKAAGLVMDMDEMVGGEFEKGLAALKTLAESGTAAPSPAEG